MAKMHTYEDEADEPCVCGLEVQEPERVMLRRTLDSIQDLLDEEARGNGTRLSRQQLHEMEEIIKDARVKGFMNDSA